MSETILVILIMVLTASMLNADVKKKSGGKKTPEQDRSTIDLIGQKAYEDMNRRVEAILKRHGNQPCISMKLTCGPDTKEGARELHSMLPGNPVHMVICREEGVEAIDVFSRGFKIGRLVLNEAGMLIDSMRKNHLRAAYVAEQNCYGMEDALDMSIIVFLEAKKEIEEEVIAPTNRMQHAEICQN